MKVFSLFTTCMGVKLQQRFDSHTFSERLYKDVLWDLKQRHVYDASTVIGAHIVDIFVTDIKSSSFLWSHDDQRMIVATLLHHRIFAAFANKVASSSPDDLLIQMLGTEGDAFFFGLFSRGVTHQTQGNPLERLGCKVKHALEYAREYLTVVTERNGVQGKPNAVFVRMGLYHTDDNCRFAADKPLVMNFCLKRAIKLEEVALFNQKTIKKNYGHATCDDYQLMQHEEHMLDKLIDETLTLDPPLRTGFIAFVQTNPEMIEKATSALKLLGWDLKRIKQTLTGFFLLAALPIGEGHLEEVAQTLVSHFETGSLSYGQFYPVRFQGEGMSHYEVFGPAVNLAGRLMGFVQRNIAADNCNGNLNMGTLASMKDPFASVKADAMCVVDGKDINLGHKTYHVYVKN